MKGLKNNNIYTQYGDIFYREKQTKRLSSIATFLEKYKIIFLIDVSLGVAASVT